jgi:fucose permease
LATISLSGFWGGMILLRFLTARFYQHARKIMSISILSAFVTLVLLQTGISPYLDAVLFILLGSSLAVIWPLLMSVCNQVFGAYSGTASGLMMMAGGLGGIAGPTGMNALSPFTGAHHVMVLLAVAAAIMGFLWWRTVAKTRDKKSL